jgi:hypothetical protein
MTSFANVFGSSDQQEIYSNNYGINSTNDIGNHQGSNDFSNIDLDQQPPSSSKEHHSPYLSLNGAATFQTDSSSTAGAIPNIPSHSQSFSSQQLSSSIMKYFRNSFNFLLIFLRQNFFIKCND